VKPLGLVDDQPIMRIPRRCTVWRAIYQDGVSVGGAMCGGEVRPKLGFYTCAKCDYSWGPVRRGR
jgi:hypothetical protein